MTKPEYLLVCLAEECVEVAQRATKALRFGLDEVQPGQELTNKQRLLYELCDLQAVVERLINESLLPDDMLQCQSMIDAKNAKLDKFIEYSRKLGTLTGD